MYLRRLRLIHKHGKEALEEIHRKQQEMTEALVELLHGVTYRAVEIEDDALFGQAVRTLVKGAGGVETVLANC